jgi:hypothetical protein
MYPRSNTAMPVPPSNYALTAEDRMGGFQEFIRRYES